MNKKQDNIEKLPFKDLRHISGGLTCDCYNPTNDPSPLPAFSGQKTTKEACFEECCARFEAVALQGMAYSYTFSGTHYQCIGGTREEQLRANLGALTSCSIL